MARRRCECETLSARRGDCIVCRFEAETGHLLERVQGSPAAEDAELLRVLGIAFDSPGSVVQQGRLDVL